MSRVNFRKHYPFILGVKNQTAVGIALFPAVALKLRYLSNWENQDFGFFPVPGKAQGKQIPGTERYATCHHLSFACE